MEQILDGFTNEQTLRFTNDLADNVLAKQRDTGNDMITDASRDQILAEAKRSAELFALARNRNSSPRSSVGADAKEQSVIDSVIAWVDKRKGHLRGK